MLFHTGMRDLFGSISDALSRVVRLDELRWIGFGHLEADECGSLNQFLAAAPIATPIQGTTGCMVSIGDLADRARPLADGETLDIGRHRLEWIDTPHVPHAWEAGLLFDHTTRTLFCGDLFSVWGSFPPSTDDDLAAMASADEDSSWMSLAPSSPSVVRRLASYEPATLAPMHGPADSTDCRRALLDLSVDFERRIDHARRDG